MPAALDEKQWSDILDRLFIVFRDRGYDGASLADLSKATGLGKSSLYHHFPGGKGQMAEAVLEHVRAFIAASVADVARSSESLKRRVEQVAAAMDQVYAGGRNACLWGRLAVAQTTPAARKTLRDIFVLWTGAIAALAAESGRAESDARAFAEDWLARLQGALILRAANGSVEPYRRTMTSLMVLADGTTLPRAE